VDQTKLSILEISSGHSVIVNLTTKCLKISAVLETPDLLLSCWFSGTPVMQTQKGNKKQFELAGITQDRKMTLKYVNGWLDSLKSNCCCVSFGYFINLYIYYMAKKT